jgi:hypothetical protein
VHPLIPVPVPVLAIVTGGLIARHGLGGILPAVIFAAFAVVLTVLIEYIAAPAGPKSPKHSSRTRRA